MQGSHELSRQGTGGCGAVGVERKRILKKRRGLASKLQHLQHLGKAFAETVLTARVDELEFFCTLLN